MNENTNASLESWDGFLSGNWLKADKLTSESQAFVCVSAEIITDKISQKPKIQLNLESNSIRYKFDLNVANTKIVKSAVSNPKSIVGKKIYFKKVLARNPKLDKEVDSLRINKIE